MVTQLEAGALDAANLPPVRDAVRLQKDPKYQLMVNQHTGGYYLIALNTALPPLDKKEVRQALNYAIDRKRFAETVLLGTSEAESLPWPSFAPAYEAAKKNAYAFDLDKARSVLNQAGVSGFEMDLVFSTVGAVTEYTALGQVYQADLAKIGVKLNLKPLEAGVWRDQVGNHKFNGLNADSSRFANLESVSVFSTSVYWLPQANAENFNDPEYKRLVDAASTEPDLAARQATVFAAQRFPAGPVVCDGAGHQPAQRAHTRQCQGSPIQRPRRSAVHRHLADGMSRAHDA
jgi:peptide/nickel transport system substrate-binding protein